MNTPSSLTEGSDPAARAIEKYLEGLSAGHMRLVITETPEGYRASFGRAAVEASHRDIALVRLGSLLLLDEEVRKPLVIALRGPYAIAERYEAKAQRQLCAA